ncbi:hypothetical protein PV379_00475 [Streptomyces caniscabiei]|uniref:hypothetical protein n=1 Tax=Streptomyces caniscabiei TaxID=2746961 RepID=UPI0029B572F5|nr:hypothetical protein [Streptomyces caniscabiei]MDX2775831.1 hypothetical protein [Streptomyces caniscabiei]
MALFIRQDDERSKLQERIATELREKAKAKGQADPALPDGVEDTNYLKDTKPTTGLAWIWVVIVVIILVLFVVYALGSVN